MVVNPVTGCFGRRIYRHSRAVLVAIAGIWLAIAVLAAGPARAELPFADAEGYFVVITDMHVGSGKGDTNSKKVVQDILDLGLSPDFIMLLGDTTEMNRSFEWRNAASILAPLRERFPLYAVPGNHDARWASLGEAKLAGTLGPTRFAVDWRGLRVVGINTAVDLEQHGHVGPEQRAWLDQVLDGAQAAIVGSHHPIGWDADFVDDQEETMAVMARHNVPLVLSGHGHSFSTQVMDSRINQMIGAALDGWYGVVARYEDRLVVYRRQAGSASYPGDRFDDVMAALLPGPVRPELTLTPVDEAGATADPNSLRRFQLTVDAAPGGESVEVTGVEFSVDGGTWQPAEDLPGGWLIELDPARMTDGVHRVTVRVRSGFRDFRTTATVVTNAHGNQLKWHLPTGDSLNCQPLVDGELVYVGNASGRFLAVNRATGQIAWEFRVESAEASAKITAGATTTATTGTVRTVTGKTGIFSSPAADAERVYFGANDGFLYALDKATGKLTWRFETGGAIYGDPIVDEENDTVLVGSGDGRFYAVKRADGKLAWSALLGGTAEGAALIVGDEVWVTSWAGAVHRLDRKTGKIKQRIANGGGYYTPGPCTPAFDPGAGVVALTNTDSKVYGFDLSTGRQRWVVAKASGYASPACDGENGRFILSTLQGEVYAVEASTGGVAWSSSAGRAVYNSSPVLWQTPRGSREVLVGTTGGHLVRFAADSGRVLGSLQLDEGFIFARVRPVDGENVVYVASMNGTLYAIELAPK